MEDYIFIDGKIVNSLDGNPIPGVQCSFTTYKSSTDENGVFIFKIQLPITVTNSTNSLSFTFNSFREVQNNDKYKNLSKEDKQYIRNQLLIKFYQKNYSQNTELFPFDSDGDWLIPDLIQLVPSDKQLEQDKTTSKLPTEDEDKIIKKQNDVDNVKIGSSSIIQSSLNKLINKVKNTLIPLVLLLLSEFGVTLLMVNQNKFQDKKKCPSPEKLLNIINRRNKIVTQLNNLYTAVNTVAQTTTLLTGFLEVLQLSITISKAIPTPTSAGISSILISLENKLGKIIHVIAGISFTSLIAASTLKQIISLLSALDSLIQQCSIDQNISLVAINNDIKKASEAINDSVYSGDFTYKGFTLEIQEDTKDNNKYIKRYAQARDTRGTIVLRGESSFSASTQILIDELKFEIDRNNLKAF